MRPRRSWRHCGSFEAISEEVADISSPAVARDVDWEERLATLCDISREADCSSVADEASFTELPDTCEMMPCNLSAKMLNHSLSSPISFLP